MDIIRHADGSLTVPVEPARSSEGDDGAVPVGTGPQTMRLRPGEGGYVEALAAWDQQQQPEGDVATSTPSGRQEAMAVVHAVATDPDHDVAEAVEALHDGASSADALRHVLVGGTPSVAAFASVVADAEGGEVLPAHQATKIIGEVLAELEP